jgi:hypothetical protein
MILLDDAVEEEQIKRDFVEKGRSRRDLVGKLRLWGDFGLCRVKCVAFWV